MPARCWIAPGDAHRDVQLRRDDLAGLTDLHVVGHKTGIDGGTRRTHARAELVRQRIKVFEVVAVLHATATRHDNLRGGQLRAIGLGQLFTDERPTDRCR